MRRASCVLSLVVITLAGGCGSSSPLLKGSLKADAGANPDLRGRPSPIVVRVYELKSVAAFNSADFFSLFEKEGETLSGDLVGREEYQLSPAETRPYQRQLQPDTKFIGVAAAFRDLEGSRWRQAAPLPAKRGASITIGIEARAVALAVK
jgi:type VI secretion system protein VasD